MKIGFCIMVLLLGLILVSGCISQEKSAYNTPSIENFTDFTNLPLSNGNNFDWKEIIKTGNYEKALDYNNVHLYKEELQQKLNSGCLKRQEDKCVYKIFAGKEIESVEWNTGCIKNQETWECLYQYIILNNKEDLCLKFPENRTVTLCSDSGNGGPHCYNYTVDYKNSCIVYTKIVNNNYTKLEPTATQTPQNITPTQNTTLSGLFPITTNSMAPTIVTGDFIQIEPVKFDDIKTGDIIAIKVSQRSDILAHRVIEIHYRTITLKGDANSASIAPEINVSEDNIIGKVVSLYRPSTGEKVSLKK